MGWQNIPGGLTQVSVGRGNNVWGVNSQDNVMQLSFFFHFSILLLMQKSFYLLVLE